jgi:hypothetical protein
MISPVRSPVRSDMYRAAIARALLAYFSGAPRALGERLGLGTRADPRTGVGRFRSHLPLTKRQNRRKLLSRSDFGGRVPIGCGPRSQASS